MKRSVVVAFSTPMLGALALLCHIANPVAQQALRPAVFSLFDGAESTNLKPEQLARLADAIRRAQVPRECPLGKLTIVTPQGDEGFQKALAAARRDAVLGALDSQGLGVAGRLFVDSIVFGTATAGNDAQYDAARDEKPPTLQANSTPVKGSKVIPRQPITVRIAARDDATRWETGIKTIQLVAESEDGRFIASENYPACSDPREKRVEATYAVPADPPPIVRLAAIAEDHAGRMVIERAEFPTGDWYGQITWSAMGGGGGLAAGGESGHGGTIDIAVSYDGRGNLTGTATGTEQVVWPGGIRCPEQGRMSARVVGQYTPGTNKMSLQFVEPQNTPSSSTCGARAQFHPVAYGVGIDNNLGNLSVLDDGRVEAEREKFIAPSTWRWSVKLKKARN